jgi:hypothetical protein
MTHPLTDKIIDTFASPQYDYFEGIGEINLGYDYDDLRGAADWQWEQVFQAWEQCLESDTNLQVISRFDHMLRAMRPTQEDN